MALLTDLAAQDARARRAAVSAAMKKAAASDHDEHPPLYQRCVQMFEEEWRRLGQDRQPTVEALARVMADPDTDLLAVNLIAYALASEGEDGVAELLELLTHPDFSVHTYAAEGLGSLDNRARWAVPALCRAFAGAQTDWTQTVIIGALGNIGGSRAIRVLQELAREARAPGASSFVQIQAVEAALASALAQEESGA